MGGADRAVVFVSYLSGCGTRWKITASETGITAVFPCAQEKPPQENALTRAAREELSRFFAGERVSFTVPLETHGTPFQERVWQVLRELPYGASVSYSHVAQMVGSPRAVRAVAQAIGRNPCLLLLPCHRVVGKDGSLTGYAAGLELKARLLALEGISYHLPQNNGANSVKSGQKIG